MNTKRERVFLSAPHMGGEEMSYIKQAFDENFVVPLGPNVDNFESNIIKYLEDEEIYAVAMNSGTAAIHIALRMLELNEGEEVFCSSLTFVASANPIMYERLKPVFIDSEEKTWNICPQSLLKAIKEKEKIGAIPRVLIVVDLFGMSAQYDEILQICDQYNIKVIEDSAESLGSSYKGKKCGLFGDFGVFSFNGNKIITTSGGGMLITHSKAQAQKALHLITQARMDAPYYLHSEVGFNYRMSNICAGIGVAQLDLLDERVKSRRSIFSSYNKLLASTPIEFIQDTNDFVSNRWLSVGLISKDSPVSPSQVMKKLSEFNIESRRIWKPLHTQPLFSEYDFFSINKQAVCVDLFERGICLPSSSFLEKEVIEEISTLVSECFS